MAVTGSDLARWRRRRLLIIWITTATLVVGALVGYVFYKPWRLEKLDHDAQAAMGRKDYTEASLKARRALQIDSRIISLAEDRAGEIYVLTNETLGPYGTTGKVLRLVARP